MFLSKYFIKQQADSGIALALITAMQQYIEEAEKQAEVFVPVVNNVKQNYDKLIKLGLGTTKNAQLLKEQVNEYNNINLNKTIAENLISFIKECHAHFGSGSILVSESAFFNILSKYKLEFAPLNQYSGVIPQKILMTLHQLLKKFHLLNM